jgi:hypothetical protein
VVFVYGVLPDQAFKTCAQKERENGNLQNKIRAQKKKAPEPISERERESQLKLEKSIHKTLACTSRSERFLTLLEQEQRQEQ